MSDAPRDDGRSSSAVLYSGLHQKQVRALGLLLRGERTADVARVLDCSDHTVKRWRADPLFAGHLRHAQLAVLQSASDAVVAAVPSAIDVVTEIMNDREQHPAMRLRAAEKIIELAKDAGNVAAAQAAKTTMIDLTHMSPAELADVVNGDE